MAYISGKYTSATDYTITLGGMAIGTVYAILVQDLNSDGSSNGYDCVWKSGATSSTVTLKRTTTSTFSKYSRRIGFFQGSFNTSVGTHITDAQFNSWADGTGTISAWGGGGSTGYVLQVASDGWPSILYSVKVTSGTFTSSNNAINYSTRQYITQISLTGTAINNRWTGNIYWKNASGSRFLVATVTNGSVSLASSIEPIDCTGNRTISFVAEGSYNTGTRVYLRCGIGISSYIVQYTDYDGIVTNKTISSTSNTYIDVKKNSTIYASSPNYVTDYEGPYHFQQWSTDFGSVTTENIGTDVTVGSTSLYLKLVGVHRPWKVTYDANGGTWTSSVTNPELVEYLGKASITDYSLAVSRKNYKLLGWFTSATGGTQWAATNIVQQDMTLYAQWEAPFRFRLSDTNEGLVSFQVNRYASQGGALLESKTISSTNFIEIVARDSNYIEITNAITAVIKDGTKEINRNGFTVPLITARADSSSNQDQNEYLKVKTEGSVTQSPVYESYGFRAGLRPNHHTFLVGSFAKSYKYSLDANEGDWTNESTNPKKSSVKSTEQVDFSKYSSLVKRIGYKLEGWGLSATGGKVTVPNGKYWITDDTNFYAIWQAQPHIILDANGGKFDGTLSTKDFYIDYGDVLDFSQYKPSWYGEGSYILLGWAENPASTSPTYGVNEVIGPLYGAGPYKYYAVWQKSRATLTFYGNGGLWYGNLQKQSKTYKVGETVSFATYSNDLVRAGYSLLGWSTSPTATDAPWDPNGIVTVGATDADYYAVWQKHIDLFYWYGNDTQDAAKIAKGQPVTNLTATIWNEFKSRINQLTIAETGRSWSYSDVLPGDSITAAEVLAARNALAALNNNVPLPTANQLQTGKQILASYFNGTGSLKAALNIIINNYNKS